LKEITEHHSPLHAAQNTGKKKIACPYCFTSQWSPELYIVKR